MLRLAVWFLIFLGASSAYDIGCLYPKEMPGPFRARDDQAVIISDTTEQESRETPIVVHRTHMFTYCQTLCLAMHDDKALDLFTKERPLVSTPPKYFNAYSRTMCYTQCMGNLLLPNESLETLHDEWDFQVLPLNKDLVDCKLDKTCLMDVTEQNDFDPRIVGQVAYLQIEDYVRQDGWNSKGEYTYSHEMGKRINCTANCDTYADTTGYFPKNHPHEIEEENKYEVQGDDMRWQPLMETDGFGNFKRQEHVTPHIGYEVTPQLITEWKEAEDPEYNYKKEANLVINRLRKVVTDELKRQKVKFYDNKRWVRRFIQSNLFKGYRLKGLSFEDYLIFLAGISTVEYDSIIQCWREKVRFDRVRPTTVIKRGGTDAIYTYNGDPESTKPEIIAAHDFQAFIRVMPHGEYPSGSASICTGYADYTDLFTQEFFGENMGDSFDLIHGYGPWSFDIHNMTELAFDCGESRLWGGMHFTASIQAGKDIVKGLGQLGLDFALTLKNGSNWTNPYNFGSSRPICEM